MDLQFVQLGKTVWLARRGEHVIGYVGLDGEGYVAFDADFRPILASPEENVVRASFSYVATGVEEVSSESEKLAMSRSAEFAAAQMRRISRASRQLFLENPDRLSAADVTILDRDMGVSPIAVLLRFADGGVVLVGRLASERWKASIETDGVEIDADADALSLMGENVHLIADFCRRLDALT